MNFLPGALCRNHVHILVDVKKTPLWKMVRSWKRFIATNEPARRAALQWQREYWDTFMRDEEQTRTAIRYIEANPVKAKLCRVPEEWLFSSARFRDEYRRLRISKKTNS